MRTISTKHKIIITTCILVTIIIGGLVLVNRQNEAATVNESTPDYTQEEPGGGMWNPLENTGEETSEEINIHPMAIESLRQRKYSSGELMIEETLPNGTNYQQFVASYQSEGLKIYGLLTIPLAPKPDGGYPTVIFVHGHIPPRQYSTVNSYPTYQAALARGGFITFKPDLRGHGDSEGEPSSAHYSEKYTIDTINALAYLKMHEDVNPSRIGYWGHSNGGEIGLRTILVDPDIKAASFWAGVVGSYEDMFETYINDIPFLRNDNNPLVQQYGLPSQNPDFWNTIEPYNYIEEIDIPIELQHGTNDDSVPVELSYSLRDALQAADKNVTYIEYLGDDHNIGQNSSRAWQQSIAFFHEHL